MRILVTGAGGFVGREVAPLASKHHEVLGCTREMLDICDRPLVERVFDQFRPSVVLHCAAYTDVDAAEGQLDSALAVNSTGTAHVARAAARLGSAMLYLSTDYVFDGDGKRPYSEDDVVAPRSHYALSKLEGERQVEQICSRFIIFRTGWLYGRGKGFVDWLRARLALDEPETVDLVEDQWGSPTWVRHLAAAMLRAAERDLRGVFHVVNRGVGSWYEVGQRVASHAGGAGAMARLRPVSGRTLARPAPRPRYTPLDVGRFERASESRLATWEDALEEYLLSGDSSG